MGINIPDMV